MLNLQEDKIYNELKQLNKLSLQNQNYVEKNARTYINENAFEKGSKLKNLQQKIQHFQESLPENLDFYVVYPKVNNVQMELKQNIIAVNPLRDVVLQENQINQNIDQNQGSIIQIR